MRFDLLKAQVNPFSWDKTTSHINAALLDYLTFYSLNDLVNKAQYQMGVEKIAGFTINIQQFLVTNAKASVIIVHGYYDHVGLYGHLINYALEQNYNVLCFDLPGHGLSSGESANIQSFQQYDVIFSTLLERLNKTHKQPIYAFGQSTGGAIILNYLLKSRNQARRLDKAVLLAPLVKPRGWRLGLKLVSIINLFIQQRPRQIITNPANPDFSDFLRQDPLQATELKLQWVIALKHWLTFWLKLPPLNFPLYVVQGNHDQTVDWQHNQPIILQKFPQRKLHILAKGQHHLVNDSIENRTIMFATISQWLNPAP